MKVHQLLVFSVFCKDDELLIPRVIGLEPDVFYFAIEIEIKAVFVVLMT